MVRLEELNEDYKRFLDRVYKPSKNRDQVGLRNFDLASGDFAQGYAEGKFGIWLYCRLAGEAVVVAIASRQHAAALGVVRGLLPNIHGKDQQQSVLVHDIETVQNPECRGSVFVPSEIRLHRLHTLDGLKRGTVYFSAPSGFVLDPVPFQQTKNREFNAIHVGPTAKLDKPTSEMVKARAKVIEDFACLNAHPLEMELPGGSQVTFLVRISRSQIGSWYLDGGHGLQVVEQFLGPFKFGEAAP